MYPVDEKTQKNMHEQIAKVIVAMSKLAEDAGFDDWWLYNQLFKPEFVIKHILECYFGKVETYACSADKATFTYNKMLESIEIKKSLCLQETYAEHKNTDNQISVSDEDLQKICYWCPKTLKTTDDAFKLIYRAISNTDYTEVK